MRPGPWFVAGLVTVAVGLAGSARAEEVAAPAPAAGTEEYYPPAPPTGVWRPFSLTLAAGPGCLIGPGEQALALSHNLVRVGWGLARNLTVFASFEGARAPSVNPRTHANSWLIQDTLSVGVQRHFRESEYVRGSAGIGWVSEQTGSRTFSGGRGLAVTVAAGHELARLPRAAVGVELAGNLTRYATELWGTVGLNMVVSFF